ncbi:MAG: dihydrofolate reductase [Eubacterium sp.]|nr:dihydrofolate reductase [Eubacterium sp.]
MKAIVCVDLKWGIGNKGKTLVEIPADLRFFRDTTMGNVVVMGRKTLETLPGGSPLRDRTNIILSKNENFRVDGAAVVHSVDELLEELKKYDTDRVYVIGGEHIYRLLLPYCDTCYVTKVDYSYEADRHFPDLDQSPKWKLAEEGEEETYFDIEYTFCTYKRINKVSGKS